MRYWKRVKDNKTTTVESYSHNLKVKGAIEIEKSEFDDFIASLAITLPEPIRDLATELDDHEARIKKLEQGG